jgi:glutathione S-transferase
MALLSAEPYQPNVTLELYELPGCPYCAKVVSKLDELDLDYVSHEVPNSHGKRDEVKEISGQTGVPVLIDTEHDVDGMPESDDIVAYLEKTYGEATA